MVPLEIKLQNWLLQEMSIEDIAVQLQDTHQEWNQRDTIVGFQFLYQSGQQKKIAKLLSQRIREKRWIPWGLALRLMVKAFPKMHADWLLAFSKGIKRQNAQDQTWGFRDYDESFDFWAVHRAFFQSNLSEQIISYKKRLLEQIEYFQSQRLLDREEKALKKLLTLDPHNPELAKQWQNFRERWATSVLQKKREPIVTEPQSKKDPKLDKWLNVLLKDVQSYMKQDSRSLLDFSILMLNMEEWDKALELYLNKKVPWGQDLRGEIYLKANRFLELVEWCNKQEELNADEIDHLVAIYYLKAHALNSLGEKGPALDILKDIQSLRPNYRSIDSLISHWSRGEEG